MNKIDQEDFIALLEGAHQKMLLHDSPTPMKMMAAKGLAPFPPRETILILCGLTLDQNEQLQNAATETLQKLPDKILNPAFDMQLPPCALSVLAPLLATRSEFMSKIVLLPEVPDQTLADIAPLVDENVAEMLANNQGRCLRSKSLVMGLRLNTKLPRSSFDRVIDFLVRSGVIYEEIPEFGESLHRMTTQEMVEVADKIVIPEAARFLLEEIPGNEQTNATTSDNFYDNQEDPEYQKRIPTLKLIQSLTMSQKVSLALKGNKEARSILIRDPNKIIATATVRSPRLTEQEVISATQSRSVCDDVIRIIANSKEMTRSYGVKLALVNNPKTPLATAMRLLTLLRQTDVRNVSKSRNISSALANQAKRLGSHHGANDK